MLQMPIGLPKAFAIYFELTNLAETNHRKRRRRASRLHPEQPPLLGHSVERYAAGARPA